jgi:hypothetical protein
MRTPSKKPNKTAKTACQPITMKKALDDGKKVVASIDKFLFIIEKILSE